MGGEKWSKTMINDGKPSSDDYDSKLINFQIYLDLLKNNLNISYGW